MVEGEKGDKEWPEGEKEQREEERWLKRNVGDEEVKRGGGRREKENRPFEVKDSTIQVEKRAKKNNKKFEGR